MWVLLGVSDDTVENETFVFFIGIFDDVQLAIQERDRRIETEGSQKKQKKSDFIIKTVSVNQAYDYDWSNNDEDEIKS